MSPAEIWGQKAKLDSMAFYFNDIQEKFDLVDITPPMLEPTWTDGRWGKEGIHKRLDRFVAKASLAQRLQRHKTWVGMNKFFDHWPFFL